MGKVLETLKDKKLTLTGNIDNRYFQDNGDGTYSPTTTLIYNILRDAQNYYKDKIFQLDSACNYHSEEYDVMLKDTWTEKITKEERERKYGPQLKELEKRKRDWREANPDKCNVISGSVDLGDIDEMKFFAGYTPDLTPSLSDAVSLYKYLYEFDKEHKTELTGSMEHKPDYLKVKKEYESEYTAFYEKVAEELGIPVEPTVVKIPRTKYSIARSNSKVMKAVTPDDTGLEDYINGLITFLTGTDKEAFLKKRSEMITFINTDFVIDFNESSKDLKAESDTVFTDGVETVTTIEIYTKATETENAEKIIVIEKEDPADKSYKYKFSIITDDETLRYNKNINTKADLRKALEMTITMIEDIDTFKKYVKDIENTIDKLN